MAVPEQTPYVEYIANGISTQFSVPFQCLSKNTLIVSIDGVETLPQLWNFNSGEIIFITAPLDNSTVSIKRTTSLKREVTYDSYSNSMLPTVFNGDFDRIWHVLQEYQFGIDNKVGILRKINTSGNLQGGGSLEEDLTLFLKEQAVSAGIAFGSSIKIPVITLNQDGTVKSLQEVDLIGGEGGAFQIGWGDVLNKPVTLAGYGITDAYTKSEIYTKTEANTTFIENSEKAVASGVATLDANTKVPAAQLPLNNTLASASTTEAATAAMTKKLNDEKLAITAAFGVGQTWQNVIGSRVKGTTYTNSTGKTIHVVVDAQTGNNITLGLYVNGVAICTTSVSAGTTVLAAPVAGGATYSVVDMNANGANPTKWMEFR